MIFEGQICAIINRTVALDFVTNAQRINYPVVTGKHALLSCDNTLIYPVSRENEQLHCDNEIIIKLNIIIIIIYFRTTEKKLL